MHPFVDELDIVERRLREKRSKGEHPYQGNAPDGNGVFSGILE
jgi:hypothetical protein